MAGDVVGQGVALGLGWRDTFSWPEVVGSGVIGGIGGGIGGYIGGRGGPCFLAGTLVWTAEGKKPIEAVRAGERVLSRDERTGAVSYQKVARTFRRVSPATVTVRAGEEIIKTTPEHPFWVEGKGWVAAKELAKGERLVTPNEEALIVRAVKVEAVRGPPVAVYNLEVESTHTYFVGKQGVWVHNSCDEILTRYAGGKESAGRLTRHAEASLANPEEGVYGVSVTAGPPDPTRGAYGQLPRSVVEQHFPVHNTPLGIDPFHRTVELPNPVTKEVAVLWNNLWGFK